MPAEPTYVVLRADGREAAALFDLPHQRKVCLRIEDDALAEFLAGQGIASPRPPFLDAGGRDVRGAYAALPQRNWFLAPPLESVVSVLEAALAPAGYRLIPADVPQKRVGKFPTDSFTSNE
jgi:hypothetical protein